MQISKILVMYFVIGAVMFGGGAVTFDNSGVTAFFVDMADDGSVEPDSDTQDKLTGLSGAITSLVGQFGGPLVLVWNLVVGIVAYLHWPVTVLVDNHAPPRVTLLLGGTFTAMFYVALISLVRSSA